MTVTHTGELIRKDDPLSAGSDVDFREYPLTWALMCEMGTIRRGDIFTEKMMNCILDLAGLTVRARYGDRGRYYVELVEKALRGKP